MTFIYGFNTFQFNYNHVFNNNIRDIITNTSSLVIHLDRNLTCRTKSP